MKPAAQGGFDRRTALRYAAAMLAAGLTRSVAAAARRSDKLLTPMFTVQGARLMARTDLNGYPPPNSIGAYQPLMNPAAIAAGMTDLYIADIGAARLYRYDRTLDAMAIMPERRIGTGVRLQIGPDNSIYVLDPYASEIRRYMRNGQALPTLRPRLTSSRYTEFAVHPLTGRCYAVDSANRCIDQIEPLGQLAIEFQRLDDSGPIAVDNRGLYVAGSQCRCVAEWIDGRRGRNLGGKTLTLPKAVTLHGKQVCAIDAFDRHLLLANEEGAERISPQELGMQTPDALASDQALLYVADGSGHKVTAFHLRRRT